jgi:hypothetical protein
MNDGVLRSFQSATSMVTAHVEWVDRTILGVERARNVMIHAGPSGFTSASTVLLPDLTFLDNPLFTVARKTNWSMPRGAGQELLDALGSLAHGELTDATMASAKPGTLFVRLSEYGAGGTSFDGWRTLATSRLTPGLQRVLDAARAVHVGLV